MCEWVKGRTPRGFWREQSNRLRYADWLGKTLGYTSMDDWYSVRKPDFRANFGGALLGNYYDNSAARFVQATYPDYPWKPWKFGGVPIGYWDEPSNRHAFMSDLGSILGYKKPEDWYAVTCRLIHEHGGGGLLVSRYKGSPQLAVIEHIPDFPWQLEKFTAGKKNQKAIFSAVQQYLWSMDPQWDFKNRAMRFYQSDFPMELDVYIPHLQIAIEYQGEQHFVAIECWGGEKALRETQARDEEKRKMCKAHHVALIEVNYWWRGNTKAVIEAIQLILEERQKNRPEFKMISSKSYRLFLPVKKTAPEVAKAVEPDSPNPNTPG